MQYNSTVYIKDDKGVRVAGDQFFFTTREYWLGKIKPKIVFGLTRNVFVKLLQNFNFLVTEF